MSSELDPAKLKVVELRAELQARGLDVKGNKPVLVKRLKEALEEELEKDIPETTIADTSTEELNSSQDDAEDSEPTKPESPKKDKKEKKEVTIVPVKEPTPEPETIPEAEVESKLPEPTPESEKQEENVEPVNEEIKDEKVVETTPAVQEEKMEEQAKTDEVTEQNGDSTNGDQDEESSEPKNRKSRWGSESKEDLVPPEPMEQDTEPAVEDEKSPQEESEQVGVKRKHSPSPERLQQRRRSKSPNKEDDPVIDSSKVQLSWYDSDLHLQIDKETFLSAKPLHDGVFGYIWSGARLSHGIKSGKVAYEVKITEELNYEDILKIPLQEPRQHRGRDNKRRPQGRVDNKSKKPEEEKVENEVEQKTGEAEVWSDENTEEKKVDEEVKETDEEAVDKADKPVETIDNKMDESEEKSEKKEDEEKKDDVIKPDEEVDNKNKDNDEVKDVTTEETDVKEADEKKEDQQMDVDEAKEAEEEEKIEENYNIPLHLIRIGWSSNNSSMQLGEDKYSYGLESTGKFFINKEFTEHDVQFGINDVVTSYLDMNESSITFSFAVNGEIKMTTTLDRSEIDDENLVLYPHILTRNYSFDVNAGEQEEAWFPTPETHSEFVYLSKAEEKIDGPSRPENRSDCEVIMMCGLPSSGKTHWVEEYIEQTPDIKYTIIGNKYLVDKMTVDAKPIEDILHKIRWQMVNDKLIKCLNRLCEMAALRKRNYILDQTNVFPSAQRRKMRSFWDFKRHAVIVVNEDEEQTRRMRQQETLTGKDIPESTVLEMKANMQIPQKGVDCVEKVTFTSLGEAEAKVQVQKYNAQGKEAGYGNMQHRRDYRDDRNYNHRWGGGGHGGGGPRRDYRGNYRDNNRPYHNNRYGGGDRGHRQGGWRPGGGGGGGGGGWGGPRNDRRDNRGPRDWRNNNRGGMNDRPHRGGGNRDHRNHGGSPGNFNRNRNQGGGGGRNQGGWGGNQVSNWNNQGQGGWSGQGQGQNNWTGQGWNQGQGSWNQNQWKYGGYGGGYGQYANWNYYGQYAQNWNSQGQSSGQSASSTTSTTSATTTTDSSQQYAQMTPQQQQAAWAQYAQQYAQSTATNTGNQAQK